MKKVKKYVKSLQTRKLMSEHCHLNGKTGRLHPRSVRIVAVHIETNKRRFFDSLTEASRVLGIAEPMISNVVNKINYQSHGWEFYKT